MLRWFCLAALTGWGRRCRDREQLRAGRFLGVFEFFAIIGLGACPTLASTAQRPLSSISRKFMQASPV